MVEAGMTDMTENEIVDDSDSLEILNGEELYGGPALDVNLGANIFQIANFLLNSLSIIIKYFFKLIRPEHDEYPHPG